MKATHLLDNLGKSIWLDTITRDLLTSGQKEPRSFPFGPRRTPRQMPAGVKELANRIVKEPHDPGPGWTRFDFSTAFKKPVKKAKLS